MTAPPEPRFNLIAGTGAIGAGVVFRLEDDHDLGRNESRRAVLLNQRDYFKLHIILHYAARLLGEAGCPVRVLPIGAVGSDDAGRRLVSDMKDAGMDVRHVQVRQDAPTVFGICFTYPDGTGGNLTPTNGASGFVDPEAVRQAEPEIAASGRRCLVLAAPEVPLAARRALLETGRAHGAFTAASYVSGELAGHDMREDLRLVDLLALNIDEAASLAGIPSREPAERIVRGCIDRLSRACPRMMLSVSNGRSGAYAWVDGQLEHLPGLDVSVAGTAGAGDALLSGYIIGLTAGLPFLGSPRSCFRLARLLAAMSVTSADTINFDVHLDTLRAFATELGEELPL